MSRVGPVVRRGPVGRVRQLVVALVLAILVASVVAAPSARAATPSIQAPAALSVEISTGDVVFQRRARQLRPIASTTKLMTALLALERLDPSKRILVRNYRASPAESLANLHPGDRMTVRDVLEGLLLPSGNDAAYTLAVDTAGSERAFVSLMNRRAQQLGLEGRFRNPIGLDQPGHRLSASDLVKLVLVLRKNATFRAIVDEKSATLASATPPITVTNRNDLVQQYPWVTGVKTGHTSQAGYCLVGSATRGGVSVVSVVLGDPSEAARDADSVALLRNALAAYHRVVALRARARVARLPLRYRDERVDVLAASTIRRVVRRGERTSTRVVGLPADLEGPLPARSRVGTIEVLQRGRVVARVPAVTAAAVAASSVWQRAGHELGRPGGKVLLVAAILLALLLGWLVRRRLVGPAPAGGRPGRPRPGGAEPR